MKNVTKILRGPFSHNFDGFSSFSKGLILTIILDVFFFSFNRVNPYNDTNNLCKFQKNRIKTFNLSRKGEKKSKGPFSHTARWIFFIYNRVNPYNDTNGLWKFQKNRIKNVDFIAWSRKKIITKFQMDTFPVIFDGFSSFSVALILTMMQTIWASFKRIRSKKSTSSRKREKVNGRMDAWAFIRMHGRTTGTTPSASRGYKDSLSSRISKSNT